MSTTPTEARHSDDFLLGSTVIEALGGAVALVLSILGLAGMMPMYMLAISAIALGVALVVRGVAVSTRFWGLVKETGSSVELGGEITAEFIAGAVGIVLGILALLGIIPLLLISASVLVFGSALVLGSGVTSRLNYFEFGRRESLEPSHGFAHHAPVLPVGGAQLLVGLAPWCWESWPLWASCLRSWTWSDSWRWALRSYCTERPSAPGFAR